MLTVPEAARRIGKHPETIRRWIRAGRVRSQRVGTQHLVDEQELDEAIGYAPLDLPDEWLYDDEGRRMPDWARLVRRSRDSH